MPKKIRKTIRFSETEWEQIEQKTNEHNLTFAEFARSAILRKKVKTKLTTDYIFQLQKMENEISRIGNNLNQIAKNLNSKNDVPNSKVIENLIKIDEKLEELKYDIKISTK